ncbi:MAG: hypothetical protein ACI9HK_000649 [Pirellulaceae bacterium]|jgi:hypothetical protein
MRGISSFIGLLLLSAASGCGLLGPARVDVEAKSEIAPQLENPLNVPMMDPDFVWNQVVDTVDDYFRVRSEDRLRAIEGVLIEGRMETYPRTGSTILEPWHKDSTPGAEKLHATLQSIRRQAIVRVSPFNDSYRVEVVVLKELEDLQQPEHASVGSSVRRYDNTITRHQRSQQLEAARLGWIPLGRDSSLEQEILYKLHAKLSTIMTIQEITPSQPVEAIEDRTGY